MFQLNCAKRGIQYRRYCILCWQGSNAIPHYILTEQEPAEAPLVTLDEIAAQDRVFRRANNLELDL
jgi:hypothetical protein